MTAVVLWTLGVVGWLLVGVLVVALVERKTSSPAAHYDASDYVGMGVGVLAWPLVVAVLIIVAIPHGLGKLASLAARKRAG